MNMARINECGEIIREENELTNIESQAILEELKSKIIKYIETNDYEEATLRKEKLVKNMKEEYIEYLLNEVGIRNENILMYVVNNFEQISLDIQNLLKERSKAQLEVIQNEYIHNDEERNLNITNDSLVRKTPIDYYDKVKQIIIDNINDTINQLTRILYNIGISEKQIDEILGKICEKREELLSYSVKFEEMLTDLDREIIKFVNNINKEKSNSESKFRNGLEIDNSQNQVEEKAIENITRLLNNKKQEQLKDGLNPDGIFEKSGKQSNYNSKSNALDARDIF